MSAMDIKRTRFQDILAARSGDGVEMTARQLVIAARILRVPAENLVHESEIPAL